MKRPSHRGQPKSAELASEIVTAPLLKTRLGTIFARMAFGGRQHFRLRINPQRLAGPAAKCDRKESRAATEIQHATGRMKPNTLRHRGNQLRRVVEPGRAGSGWPSI